MTDRTITALYSDRADAERARDQLKSANLNADVDIHGQGGADAGAGHEGGLLDSIKHFFGGHEDTHAYGEGLRRGNYLLTAKVDDDYADEVVRILESSNAVDFDETQAGWRNEGWTGGQSNAIAQPLSSPPLAGEGLAGETVMNSGSTSTGIDSLRGSGADEQVIPIVEEQLRVGKREVERGGVRVRSYVVETPVHEQIGLREEHVSIERRPTADRTLSAGDNLFQERNIELTETAEEAVVAKDAVVREELVVRKEASERVQEVNDTVRRTEVDVDDTTGRTIDPSANRSGI